MAEQMTPKKFLYCASTAGHLRQFHLPYMQSLQQMGYEVIACVNEPCELPYADKVVTIPFEKQITSIENVKNILRVYRLLKTEQFHAISVHTTLAAAVVRAAVKLLPKGKRPKVFSTCHGYLFSEDDGIGKWKYLLPEKLCASVTDVLMVMNQEDKEIAQRHKLYREKLISIDGMGVNFDRLTIAEDKQTLRAKYGIAPEDVVLVFAGEFSERKNQQMLIDTFAKISDQLPNAMLILAGEGALLDDMKRLADRKDNGKNNIHFPGYVKDIGILYRISDVCVSASKIEGLPFNIMEAMYSELPCVVSDIKGHRDLITNGKNGYLFHDEKALESCLIALCRSAKLRKRLGEQGKEDVQQYALEQVQPQIMKIYEENL